MEIGLNENTISILLTFGLFILFFVVGYTSKKRSGGAFMLISGFTLISFEFLASSYLNAFYIVPFLTPASILIMLIGVRKWLWMPEGERTKSEGQ